MDAIAASVLLQFALQAEERQQTLWLKAAATLLAAVLVVQLISL